LTQAAVGFIEEHRADPFFVLPQNSVGFGPFQ
jgi:hypothetical protein